MTDPKITTARALLDALTTKDFSDWQALMAPGFTCSYPGMRGAHPKEAAVAFNTVFPAAFPDLAFTVTAQAVNGDLVYLSWTAIGTHLGPLTGPEGTLPPTRRKGAVQGVSVVTLKDGMIQREETYWNLPDLIVQLTGQPVAA